MKFVISSTARIFNPNSLYAMPFAMYSPAMKRSAFLLYLSFVPSPLYDRIEFPSDMDIYLQERATSTSSSYG